jgi:hypothetical protein
MEIYEEDGKTKNIRAGKSIGTYENGLSRISDQSMVDHHRQSGDEECLSNQKFECHQVFRFPDERFFIIKIIRNALGKKQNQTQQKRKIDQEKTTTSICVSPEKQYARKNGGIIEPGNTDGERGRKKVVSTIKTAMASMANTVLGILDRPSLGLFFLFFRDLGSNARFFHEESKRPAPQEGKPHSQIQGSRQRSTRIGKGNERRLKAIQTQNRRGWKKQIPCCFF